MPITKKSCTGIPIGIMCVREIGLIGLKLGGNEIGEMYAKKFV